MRHPLSQAEERFLNLARSWCCARNPPSRSPKVAQYDAGNCYRQRSLVHREADNWCAIETGGTSDSIFSSCLSVLMGRALMESNQAGEDPQTLWRHKITQPGPG